MEKRGSLAGFPFFVLVREGAGEGAESPDNRASGLRNGMLTDLLGSARPHDGMMTDRRRRAGAQDDLDGTMAGRPGSRGSRGSDGGAQHDAAVVEVRLRVGGAARYSEVRIYWRETFSSIEAPDHWLIMRFSVRRWRPSQEIRISASKGREASMSLPAGSVWGMM